LIFSERRRKWKLQGVVSIHVFAIPIWGFFKSSSKCLMDLSIARAGARDGPSVIV
jgi:hypothetical protein